MPPMFTACHQCVLAWLTPNLTLPSKLLAAPLPCSHDRIDSVTDTWIFQFPIFQLAWIPDDHRLAPCILKPRMLALWRENAFSPAHLYLTKMVRLNQSWYLNLLAISSIFTIGQGQYFDGFDAFANQNKRCKLYSCDKGYEPVPNKKMTFQSAGCDAMGSGNINLFGGDEDEDGKPYEDCCHEWHACNQICGISKQNCDDTYAKCTEEKCKGKDPNCLEQANMNMMMNGLAGCKSFEVIQNKACTCVTKYGDRHVKQREEALLNFYKKYAPKSIRKVHDLAKKADSMTKMAKLLQKLIKKYPESIELVEDPQTKMYRQMFGNAGFGGADFGGADFGGFGGAGGAGGEADFDDVDDFDVDEDLGAYGEEVEEEEEEEEVPPPPPKKKKKTPPPPPVEEEEEVYDEFDQYQEL